MNQLETATDQIYRDLRTKIVSGDLTPGARLVQRQLASQYGTSSIPVIESIRMLERDGLVANTTGLGAHVREWSHIDILALYLLRQAFEGTVCRLFAEYATSIDKFILKDLGRKYDELALMGDVNGYVEADIELHVHMSKCSGSQMMVHFTENSCVITGSVKNHMTSLGSVGVVGSHDELIAAVTEGDPDEAEAAGRKHIEVAIQELRQALASSKAGDCETDRMAVGVLSGLR